MVQVRVEVGEGAVMHGLFGRLAGLLGRSLVSCDQAVSEVSVYSRWEGVEIDRVLAAVESWLAADGLGSSATLSVGDCVYTMVGSACLAAGSASA
jgi:hypothetical protein